jgi:uncharacterized protein (DUF362 family)/NAD-dependent dihydropyrimidine dehydrogenase PreA subunit
MTSTTVSLVKCADYSAGLRQSLETLLRGLGGIGAFVKPGQSVLIKPNLLSDHAPDEAVTTHPEVVRALIRILKEQGAKVCVADCPASVVRIEQVWEKTGFAAMCREEQVPLLNMEKTGAKAFEVNGYSFSIARPILDTDVLISVSKLKTHSLTVLTAAVKNMYGAIPGFQKAMLHKMHTRPADFAKLLSAIYSTVPPALNIADAVVGMDGEGPGAGNPIKLGFLAASADAVALDIAICRILGIKPEVVPYLTPHAGRAVDIVGAALSEVAPRSFKLPGSSLVQFIPQWIIRILQPFVWIRPAITDKCVFCGRCIKACPTEALSWGANVGVPMTSLHGTQDFRLHRDKPGGSPSQATEALREKPVLDPVRCVGCCCCHEICPEKAIMMTQSPFLTMVRRGRKL